MHAFKSFTVLTAALILATGCTPKMKAWLNEGLKTEDIISDRPQNRTQSFFVLKLKNAPLLTSVKKTEKGLEVDSELAEAIKTEQASAEEAFKKISPEIRIIFKYHMVLNGFGVLAPLAVVDQLKKLNMVAQIETASAFARPKSESLATLVETKSFNGKTSVCFIGACTAHENLGINGRGVKVGIIDTGIDFTHAMLGGDGNPETFKSIDPTKTTLHFPNKKVIGGMDFAGTEYNTASDDFSKHIPVPDENPLDEGGHGTHVAGTVAGNGDDENTYSGVAPEALLYALKVFGKDGSTDDATVIAALEYSADPNRDMALGDQLDVVNLSLGSDHGLPKALYQEAISNLVEAGTVVVTAAGNEGPEDYIVGAPSTTDKALSVAASIDNMDHNLNFLAAKFTLSDNPEFLALAVEAGFSKPLKEIESANGELVYIGLGDKDLTDEQKEKVKGNIALIDRGVITFVDKAKKAEEAGAIAAIIVNNQAGEPFGMGGSGSTEIPAVMISQADGEVLKEEMKKTAVRGDLKSGKTVFRPELMDTLTSFSSKGPRSIDSHIKPEVAAPGMMIVSAEMGGGKAGVKLSGTSMATPHVAGVAALLRQKEPNLTADQVKSRIVGSTLTIKDEKGVRYPVSRQGAGRVDVMRVLTAGVQAMPATVSLGEVSIETRKKMRQSFAIQNNTAEEMVLDLSAQTVEGLQVQVPQSVKVKANSSETITLDISIQAKADNNSVKELDGWVFVKKQNQEVSRIPLLAVVKRISKVSAEKLTIHSSGEEDSDGSLVTLSLKNSSAHAGDAYLFNLIGKDGRKVNLTPAESHLDTSCDLESAGYRLIVKSGVPTLQVAFKLYNALTRWSTCQLTALVDADGDGIAEQELAGIVGTQLKGIESKEFMSLLMDAKKVREIRKAYEGTLGAPEPVKENYVDAIIADAPMVFHNHSTIAIVETPLKALARAKDGSLRIKVGSLQVIGDAQEADDFMGQGEEQWKSIRPYENSEAFVGLPEKVSLKAGEATEVSFEKGKGAESLLVLMPQNLSFPDGIVGDRQSQIVAPIFGN